MYLNNAQNNLLFSKNGGAVEGLLFSGNNLLSSATHSFTLGLRLSDGNLKILSAGEFCGFSVQTGNASHELFFCGHPGYPGLEVKLAVRAEGNFFLFRPEVHGIPSGTYLEWIDAPHVRVPRGGRLFWPKAEGILIDDPDLREKTGDRYHILGFLDKSSGGYYPGVCQMQFLSYEKDGIVIYFGAHDRSHGTKGIEFAPDGPDGLRLSLQIFCGGGSGGEYVQAFDTVLCALKGDWMDACSVYRDWIRDDPMLPPRGNLPPMVRESPVVMIYPVRGRGDDKGGMEGGNEYFPYENGLPAVEKYANAFDSKILALLMHWEGTAPWAPPYVWPPFGGEKMLEDYAERLHESGHYLGVYCSGTAWTQKSCIVPYSREAECEQQGLRRQMIRGPHGEINALICNGENAQRLGFDMCLTEEWPRRTVREEIRKLTGVGIDYAQFFDQNLGGAFHPCYSQDHAHPPVPGAWQTDAMKSLLEEITADIRESGGAPILGCEAAAADAYLRELPFSDLRSNMAWGYGVPAPGYEFVFHEYLNNFMGNQCGISYWIDCEASPENLLYRTAYAFNAGNLLSILLRDKGQIHWGWVAPWDMPLPDQPDVIALIRNLNAARKKYGAYLQYGRMEKPLLNVVCGTYKLHLANRVENLKSCLHSAWIAEDGSRCEFLTNFLPEEQHVHISVPDGCSVRIGTEIRSGGFEWTLEALNTAICLF